MPPHPGLARPSSLRPVVRVLGGAALLAGSLDAAARCCDSCGSTLA